MSDKTVAAKLRILPGTTVWVSDGARAGLLGPLPDGASLVGLGRGAQTMSAARRPRTSSRSSAVSPRG